LGIDINPALVASAKQLAELFQLSENTQFLASDIVEKGTLPKDDIFDLIYIRYVISEVKQPGLRELVRHLSQDGLLVILEPDFSMCRAFGLPHFDAHLHREGEIAREAGLSGGNLRHLLREARLEVTRFEPHLQIITEEDDKWIAFAKKRLATVYEEEIPKIESLRFRRGSQWVDERINRLRNQHTELDKLTKRHRFTHHYMQFLAHATK
jgi:SAM-dependent methyltransferase